MRLFDAPDPEAPELVLVVDLDPLELRFAVVVVASGLVGAVHAAGGELVTVVETGDA